MLYLNNLLEDNIMKKKYSQLEIKVYLFSENIITESQPGFLPDSFNEGEDFYIGGWTPSK